MRCAKEENFGPIAGVIKYVFFNYIFLGYPAPCSEFCYAAVYLVVGFPIFNPKVFLLVIFLKEINQNNFFNLKMNIFYKNRMNTETDLQIQYIYIYMTQLKIHV